MLAAPPPPNAYDHLKATILARTTESESSRLRQLLNAQELGDRRPTQLLHRMRQLLGMRSSEAHNNILRELFVQRLPAIFITKAYTNISEVKKKKIYFLQNHNLTKSKEI